MKPLREELAIVQAGIDSDSGELGTQEEAEAALERIRGLIVEHHAAGALQRALPGETCPVCARLGAA